MSELESESEPEQLSTGMPFVTTEIINSIKAQQSNRSFNDTYNGSYFKDIVEDVEKENPHLFETIHDTALGFSKELSERGVDDKTSAMFFINLVNFGCCVYESIKQQMICDSLE